MPAFTNSCLFQSYKDEHRISELVAERTELEDKLVFFVTSV